MFNNAVTQALCVASFPSSPYPVYMCDITSLYRFETNDQEDELLTFIFF